MNSDLILNFILPSQLNNVDQILRLLQSIVGLTGRHGEQIGKWELGSLGIGKYTNDRVNNWRNLDDIVHSKADLQKIFTDPDMNLWLTMHFTGVGASQTLFSTIEWEEKPSQPIRLRMWMQHTAPFTKKDNKDSKDYRVDNATNILNLATIVYEVCCPQFGWVDRCKPRGHTQIEDVKKLSIPHIYWANFFGSDYVNKYGLSYFADSPGWKFENLNDGGCLYVMSPSLGPVRKGNSTLKTVIEYFGVESVRCK